MNVTLNFLIDSKAVGILAKITLLIMEKGFDILENSKEKSKNIEQYHLILLLSYDSEKLTEVEVDNLIEELSSVEHVHEVLKTHLKKPEALLTLANKIVQSYPDIIGHLREYEAVLDDEKNENKTDILYEIGEISGKKIALNRYRLLDVDDSIAKALKKIVLPTISPFALAKIKDNELHVTMCPFCMGAHSSLIEPQCSFLVGFITGLINTKEDVQVEEIKCRVQKNPACVFLVSKKY